jgi:predicted SAM-dependent methyltransferase
MLHAAGLEPEPLEYFDDDGVFHQRDWDPVDGMIMRSARFDKQVEFRRGNLNYTSLIVDARLA